jgi:hypothetical protein
MRSSVAAVLASALALAACNTSTGNDAQPKAAAGTQSGIDLSAIDKSVVPGDDFDKYANGTWEKTAQIPPDKSNIGVFSIINDRAQQREAALVGDIVKSNPAGGSDEARIANYYKAYMNTAGIEQRGLTSTGLKPFPTKARWPTRSDARCGPIPIRSTRRISTRRTCSASSSRRASTIRRRPCLT